MHIIIIIITIIVCVPVKLHHNKPRNSAAANDHKDEGDLAKALSTKSAKTFKNTFRWKQWQGNIHRRCVCLLNLLIL